MRASNPGVPGGAQASVWQRLPIGNYAWAMAALWTALVGVIFFLGASDAAQRVRELAIEETRAHLARDNAFHRWAASHGGVYVPTDERTQPDPYLSDIAERDIVTPSGRRLTLMNPTYMFRQFSREFGVGLDAFDHLTSLQLVRPENAPDDWERSALEAFERGKQEVLTITDIDGQPYLRAMRPERIEPACLKCHAQQGYRVGDLRGGISVSVPFASYLARQQQIIDGYSKPLGALWLLGLLGIAYVASRLKRGESQRLQAVTELQTSEESLRAIADYTCGWETWFGSDRRLRWVNPGVQRLTGHSVGECLDMVDFPLPMIHPDDRDRVGRQLAQALHGESASGVTFRVRRKDGGTVWASGAWQPIFDAQGNALGLRVSVADVTRRRLAEVRLEEERAFLQTVIDGVAEPILVISKDYRVQLANRTAREAAGERWSTSDKGCCYQVSRGRSRPCGSEGQSCPLLKVVETGKSVNVIHTHLDDQGKRRFVDILASPLKDREGSVVGIVESCRDITDHKMTEARLRENESRLAYLAHHDPLTGLPNRLLFHDRLQQALARVQRSGEMLAVMFMDLDRFKVINDTLGHQAGDELLKVVTQRLTSCIRASDSVARLGGDEFMILLEGVQQRENVGSVASKLLAALSEPAKVVGHDVYVSGSVGIAVYPQDGATAEGLIKNADTAMYRAKEAGRNNYQFFEEKMNAGALQRLEIQGALFKAIDRGELSLHYQPQIDLASGRITGAEALLRWNHADLGSVPPGRFIPIAEDTGLIVPIGDWVLRSACQQASTWRKAGIAAPRVAINVSSRQFREPKFIESIARALKESDLEPRGLEIELTESLVMEDVDQSINAFDKLKQMGVSIAIDDFGTGYSSMAYLKRFPIDRLKVDRTFVHNIPADRDNVEIVAATIAMAHRLHLEVVAEGVETVHERDFLQEHSCDEAQGYLFGRPASAEILTERFREANVNLAQGWIH